MRHGLTVRDATIQVGLAIAPDEGLRSAAWPLFEAGEVEALSWSFDTMASDQLPAWLAGLLACYAEEQRVTLHGVSMSPLTAQPTPQKRAWWLAHARTATAQWHAPTISEHFGFGAAGDVTFGAPLPLPWSRAALEAGKSALSQLAHETNAAPGLENLALTLSRDDALAHGAFLKALTDAHTDAFLVLDVHNLLCQAINFDLSIDALLRSYPLDRVRELHVAGGSLAQMLPDTQPVRRDTHDAMVPDELWTHLPLVLARCPNVQRVFLERLPGTLDDSRDQAQLADDFAKLRELSQVAPEIHSPLALDETPSTPLLEDTLEQLASLQTAMLRALRFCPDASSARTQLCADESLRIYHPWLARAELRMLEVARDVTRRYSRV